MKTLIAFCAVLCISTCAATPNELSLTPYYEHSRGRQYGDRYTEDTTGVSATVTWYLK